MVIQSSDLVTPSPRAHDRVSAWLVITGLAGFGGIAAALLVVRSAAWPGRSTLLALLVVAQGLWMYRLYVIAHEGVHDKLFPCSRWLNDGTAILLLSPLGRRWPCTARSTTSITARIARTTGDGPHRG